MSSAPRERRGSPKTGSKFRVALPLHPEYRTLPMVWYVPPLSPVLDPLRAAGYRADDPDEVFGAVEDLRVPLDYVANVLAAVRRCSG